MDSGVRQVKGYELHEELGKGGFGMVYRAYQPVIGREVAIKVILPVYANQPGFIRNFESEAQLVARLEHPHIVPLFDYWRDNEGAYLVMRYLRGGSLRERIEQGRIPPDVATRIVVQLGSALALAHRNGIAHRDVKPHNVMMDEEGNAYLTDFGIARATAAAEPEEEGLFAGSPAYAAPELLADSLASPQSDIYALGIMIYEMLVGSHPFNAPTFTSLLAAQFNEPLPLLPIELELPEAVNEVLHKATDKDPARRYNDVIALALALQTALIGDDDVAITVDTTGLRNPYKGLVAFVEADANDFFGREELVTLMLERLRETPASGQTDMTRFLAVVGPSASGKSSVVQAGLLPAIRAGALAGSEGWFVVQVEPDDRPITNIYNALLSISSHPPSDLEMRLRTDPTSLNRAIADVLGAEGHLLIVIDNFEETFTLTEQEDERLHYMRLLTSAVTAPDSRVHVIIVLRADYYDRPLYDDALGSLMQERTQLVLPLTRDELVRAITSPSESVGFQVDRDLLEIMLSDVADEPGALPLMQYALSETFDYREGRRLTNAGYRATGGIFGALLRRAEAAFHLLSAVAPSRAPGAPSEQDIARQVFLRLVSLTENGYRRRRADRRELLAMGDPVAVNHVLDEFGAARLLTFEGKRATREPQVELAHEALIRVWPRLQGWLDESREDLRVEALLRDATDAWIENQRDASYLLAGGRLAQFEGWSATTHLPLMHGQTAFLNASISARDAAHRVEVERQQRELQLARDSAAASRRAATRLTMLVGVLLLAILCVGGLFGLARTAQAAAEIASAAALRSATQARSLQQAANAQVQLAYGRGEVALTLAMAAAVTDPESATAGAVLVETAYTRGTRTVYTGHRSEVMGVDTSADGRWVASAGGRYSATQRDGTDADIRLWDATTHELVHTLSGHTDTVWAVKFSPDGTILASASADQTIKLWDTVSGTLLRTLNGHTATVRSIAFTPDGLNLVSGSGAFSEGRRRPDDDFSVRLWNVADGSQTCIFEPARPLSSEVRTVVVSPDGTTALSGSGAERTPDGDNVIIVWDIARCRERTHMYGHTHLVNALAFSPDGKRFVSASADNNVIIWNLATRSPLRYLIGHTDWVNAVAFDPDGQYILSGGWDNTIILWNADSGESLFHYAGHGAPVQALAFHAVDHTFISASQDATLRQWDVENPLFLRRYGDIAADVATRTLYSPDGAYVLAAAANGTITVYNTASGARVGAFRGHRTKLYTLAFSRDGQRVLSGGSDGQLILWDSMTQRVIMNFSGHEGGVWRAVFSPDEQFILSGSDDSTVRVWNATTGQEVHRFDNDLSEVYTVAYAPDGQTFYAGTLNREIVVWDATTFTERSRSGGHTSAPYTSAVSSDGRWLVTGGYDNRLILWDAASGAYMRQFYGHSRTIVSVAFSADSQMLISASLDRTVRFWQVSDGQEIGRIEYGVALVDMAIAPDGASLTIAADDERLTRYQLPLLDSAALQTWVQTNRVVQPLACDEAALYSVTVNGC